jgi:hypothetical protein
VKASGLVGVEERSSLAALVDAVVVENAEGTGSPERDDWKGTRVTSTTKARLVLGFVRTSG